MKTNSTALGIFVVSLLLWVSPAFAQSRLLDQNEINGHLNHQLHEITFEKLPSKGIGPGSYGGLALPGTLKFHDLTFTEGWGGLEVLFYPISEPGSDSPL